MESNITDEFLSSLQDFCEMNLVYLMDDGLQVSVVKHDTYLSFVTLRYPLNFSIEEDWNDIKDSIMPFFTRLDREYNVITFDRLPIGSRIGERNDSQVQFGLRRRVLVNPALSNGGFRKNFTVNDVISDRLDLGNNWIVEIKFYVSCSAKHSLYSQSSNDEVIVLEVPLPVKRSVGSRVKKFLGFNESDFYVRLKGDDYRYKRLQDELDDLCEQFLAPLADDGFTYEIRQVWNGEFDIRLSLTDGGRINKLYDYSLVMDRFIPLVRVLCRRYDMSEWIFFYSTEEFNINKKVFSVEQICADKKPDYMITTVKLTVKSMK